MSNNRLYDVTHLDLEPLVRSRLDDDQLDQVIVQFYRSDQYDAALLTQLDALCKEYGRRINVRFYSHYPNDAFDCANLRLLPHVCSLTLDCEETRGDLGALAGLAALTEFGLQIRIGNTPDILGLPNLGQLQELHVSQDKGPPLDLAPIACMPGLKNLSISAQSHNLRVLAEHSGITRLALHRLPAKTSLEMVSPMRGLRQLSVSFGSREAMPELHHQQLDSLEVLRVRGLAELDLGRFAALKKLYVADQAQLSQLALERAPLLEQLHLDNLTGLTGLTGLAASRLAQLRLIKTPGLDLLALIQQPLPPALSSLALWTGKRKIDALIDAEQQRLGLAKARGVF